jgi:hypothetical protein
MSPTPVSVRMILGFDGIMRAIRAQREQRADDEKQHQPYPPYRFRERSFDPME